MSIKPVNFWNACDLRPSSNWLVSDCPQGTDYCIQDPPTFDLSESILFVYILASCDRTVYRLSNMHNLSSEMNVNSILTLQKILSQGIQMKKKIKYKYRSWRLEMMDYRWGSSVPWSIYTGTNVQQKKALQITLDGYTYKPMSVTSETDTQTQRTWENTPVLYAVLISFVSLSPSLSVPLTEHAGVIRLESDSKWHFTHARPCRLITQPQGCIFLVCVTPLPHTSTYTHTSAAQLHIETHKHMSQILNP